jgi:hypothetical protein
MIDKHSFPKDYDFFVVNNGIDRRNSMLRPQHRRGGSGVNGSGSGRPRGESNTSAMDIVKDEKKEVKITSKDMEVDEESSEEEDESEESSEEGPSAKPTTKAPIKPAQTKIVQATKLLPAKDEKSSEESSSEKGSSEEDSEEDSVPSSTSPRPVKPTKTARSPKPLKLRGRGGFGRVGQRGTPSGSIPASAVAATPSTVTAPPKVDDGLDGITNKMSALQFIPNSVRKARERAKSSAQVVGK